MKVLNWREFAPGLFSAGQPAANQWSAIRNAGVTTVLNLRPDEEQPGFAESGFVEAEGMTYRQMAIASAASLDVAAVDALAKHMRSERRGGLLIHCGSGNRVGALVALWAHRHLGVPRAEAVQAGRNAGLGGLEATVLQLIARMPRALPE